MTRATANLQVITNDKFRKELKTNCKVQMYDTVDSFNEFVTVGHNPLENKTVLLHNADPIVLGQAWIMLGSVFKKAMSELPQHTQDEIINFLAEG